MNLFFAILGFPQLLNICLINLAAGTRISTGWKVLGHMIELCPFNSCAGTCEESSDRVCHCDGVCRLLGDCCLDYEDHCLGQPTSDQWVMNPPDEVPNKGQRVKTRLIERVMFREKDPLYGKMECVGITLYGQNVLEETKTEATVTKLRFVTKCPDDTDEHLKMLCEDEDWMSMAAGPVCDGKLLFKNVHCARCNTKGDYPWRVFGAMLDCPSSFGNYIKDYAMNSVSHEDLQARVIHACKAAYVIPHRCSQTVRRMQCVPQLSSACTFNRPLPALTQQFCQAYSDPFVFLSANGSSFVKNPVCGVCADNMESDPECFDESLVRTGELDPQTIIFQPRFSALADVNGNWLIEANSQLANENNPQPQVVVKCPTNDKRLTKFKGMCVILTNTSLMANGMIDADNVLFNKMCRPSTTYDPAEIAGRLSTVFSEEDVKVCDVWVTNYSPVRSSGDCQGTLERCHGNDTVAHFNSGFRIALRLRRDFLRNEKSVAWDVYRFYCKSKGLDSTSVSPRCTLDSSLNRTDTRLGYTVEGILTTIGNLGSVLCLTGTLITYSIFEALRTVPGKILMCLVCALISAQITFHASFYLTHIHAVCWGICAVQHYAWMTAFAWTNILCFDLCKTGRHLTDLNPARGRCDLLVYSVYAWCVPALVWGFSVFYTFHRDVPYPRLHTCWIEPFVLLYFFIIPVACMIAFNLLAFVYFVHKIRTFHCDIDHLYSLNNKKTELLMYAKLFSVMGFTWIFGFLANVDGLGWMVYLFSVCNSLQGVAIFVVFGLSQRVRKFWKIRFFGSDPNTSANTIQTRENYEIKETVN